MSGLQVQHYLSRARDFLKGMDFLKEDLTEYRYSPALLGIHSAIAYCDALRIGFGSESLSSEDHGKAAEDLRARLNSKSFEKTQGVDRLGKLLRLKNRVAYPSSNSGLDFSYVVQQTERFAAWAEETGNRSRSRGGEVNELQELDMQHYLGRAKNAVQAFFVRNLLIPKVYFDANWNGWPLDVLAIDRSGLGDVHGVRLVVWEPDRLDNNGYSAYLERAVANAITNFADFPGHFRYLTVVCLEANKPRWIPSRGIKNQALAADGVGRVGLLFVNVSDGDAKVDEVLLKAERFRSSKQIIDLTDQFVAEHVPNWEVRD